MADQIPDSAKLLPCPFCGGQPQSKTVAIRDGQTLSCRNPKCMAGVEAFSPHAAKKCISRWNARAETPKMYPANKVALERSIAEIEAFDAAGITLSEVENEVSFTEGLMLVLHELKRLRAAPPAMDREAVVEAAAISLIVDLCGPGASQSATNVRVVEDHLRQFASTLSADAIRQGEGISIPDDLREAAHYASDGPWEVDSERNEDGAYGGGPDHGTGYDDYIILDAQGRTLFGSENSTAKLIEEEDSEDDVYAWDQVGKRNAAFIVAAVNFVRKLLATPASHASDGGKA